VDVHDKLDELTAVVENARSMPMSASCIVNRGDVLAMLDELRQLLPEEFRHAQLLLADREAVVEEGRREAARLVEEARAEQARLVSESEVWAEARRQAQEIVDDARDETEGMRREVDDYVDTKLANFEVVLTKTLSTVRRGREKLHGRHELDELGSLEGEPGSDFGMLSEDVASSGGREGSH
jgi:crotonobetainyl-CoA:carnitine CoA-transferase CaiB-like acyl-CoA transferase